MIFQKWKNNINVYQVPFFFLFILISFFYFTSYGDYVLFFQEQQFLFIFSDEFIIEYLKKPGGILELAGDFITKLYIDPLFGAIIVSIILITPSLVLLKINKFQTCLIQDTYS